MSELMRTPVKADGRKGIIVHDRLCSDGPVDPETGEPLIDPETGEPYEGPNDDMAALLHDYLLKLRSSVHIDRGRQVAPRFGVLSLVAMHTPIYVYDHPAFKKIANTAFTDGVHVFVDADFMRKLVIQEEETDGKKSGVLFLLLHELMHKLLSHVDRLRNFPPRIANIAEDLVINGKLIKGFEMVSPVKLMQEIGVGMKPSEAEKYHTMSEEVVAEMLLINERKKKQKEEDKKNGQSQKSDGSSGSSGQGGGEGGDEESNDAGEPGEENDSKSSKGNGNQKSKDKDSNEKGKGGSGEGDEEDEEYSPIHHITPEELLDIIEKNGLSETVGAALDLPKKDDVEGVGKMKAQAKLNDVDAVQTALSQAARANGQYPGQHIAEHASSVIGDLGKGKLTWKLGARKVIQGDGQKLGYTDDEADITWLLDKGTMGIDPFYSGALVPQENDETILGIIDTSGSTGGGNMRKEFLQEVLGLKQGLSGSDQARKVILFSGDSVLRGEPLEITANNVNKIKHEGVPIFGDGGTDFLSCLNQALELPVMKKEKIKVILYFTDCCDRPPSRADFEEHLNKDIKFVFFTTPGMWNEKWNQSVSSWAEVYCIEEGGEVNLENSDINKDTRKNNMRS